MLKEQLKEEQPLVYEALRIALVNGTVSHACLFAGPDVTCKKEAALLLAMSLLCENREDGFACESCNTCRRVRENGHMDFVLLDGTQKAISKDDVDALQEKFSKTSGEAGTGQRVAVLLNAGNSSLSAMNSLLKFLEEPGKDITIILTVDNISQILPTIVSRCTVLYFVRPSEDYLLQKARESGIEEEDVWFVSHLAKADENVAEFVKSDMYTHAVAMLKQCLGINGPFSEWLVDYDISYKLSDRTENLQMIRMFLDLLDLYCHDVILKRHHVPSWYQNAVQQAVGHQEDYAKLIIRMHREKDLCTRFNDQNLLTAQIYQKLEEFFHDVRKRN